MPVYNAQAYVGEAIQSVLSQTYANFEFVIINDGSTDGSEAVIKTFSDPRINYVNNPGNKGLIYTLNKGIELTKGAYIARMDADDICHPQRFEKQINEFLKDPQLVICGSFIKTFGKSETYVNYMPVTHSQIVSAIFLSCPFAHPSVMLKKEALLKLGDIYREDYKHAEDYDLWSRLVFTGHSKNIPEYLLNYREHNQQVSSVFADIKYQTVTSIQHNLLSILHLQPNDSERIYHLNLFKGISRQDLYYLKQAGQWLVKFQTAFASKYPQYLPDFNQLINARWLKICGNSGLGLSGLKMAFKLPFFSVKYVKFKDLIKLFYKTLRGYKQVENKQ